jgi:hypothetical protein
VLGTLSASQPRDGGGKKSASQPAGTLGRYGLQTLASWLGFNKSAPMSLWAARSRVKIGLVAR